MQVFSIFFKITRRYIASILIYFAIFSALCFIMTANRKAGVVGTFTAEKEDIAVIDRDHSDASKNLYDYLGTLHNIKDTADDKDTLQNELYYHTINYILIIPEGFSKNLTAGNQGELVQNVKVPNSIRGIYIDNQINHYLTTLKTYLASGYDLKGANEATQSALKQSASVDLVTNTHTNSKTESFLYFFQYFTYVILCMIISGLGPILLSFRNKDVNARISASALSLRKHNVNLILCSSLFSFLCWLLFVVLAGFFFPSLLFTKLWGLCMINSFLYLLISVSITFLISTFAKTIQVFSIMSNIFGLGMSFLCGVFVPAQFMSKQVLQASQVLPAYWYMDAHNHFSSYVSTGNGLSTILTGFGLEILFCLAILSIGIVITKAKRQNA